MSKNRVIFFSVVIMILVLSSAASSSGDLLRKDFTFNIPVTIRNGGKRIASVKVIANVSSNVQPLVGAYLIGTGEKVYDISNKTFFRITAKISFNAISGKNPLHAKSWSVLVHFRKKGSDAYYNATFVTNTDPNIGFDETKPLKAVDEGTIKH